MHNKPSHILHEGAVHEVLGGSCHSKIVYCVYSRILYGENVAEEHKGLMIKVSNSLLRVTKSRKFSFCTSVN